MVYVEGRASKLIRYLIGGFGNQTVQMLGARRGTVCSNVLMNKAVCSLLRFRQVNNGPQVSAFGNSLGLIGLPLLAVDLLLARVLKFSLLTRIDLVKLGKIDPMFVIFEVGYFFEDFGRGSDHKKCLRALFETEGISPAVGFDDCTVLHVRGGDYLDESVKKLNGLLDVSYYECAIASADCPQNRILVVSDDAVYAKALLNEFTCEFLDLGWKDTVAVILGCHMFVSSNSTFGLLAGLARNGKTFVPEPFFCSSSFKPRAADLVAIKSSFMD